jgi:endonuclease/exonuclease/phosphatase family metal-dependent hydrolase
MLISLLLWLHLWQLAGASGPAQAPAPTPAAALKVMSFNVRMGIANDGDDHWTKRREQLFALLRDQRADIVGLQEAMRFQLEEIVRAVPEYDFVGVGRTDGRQAGEYSAILYRTSRLTPRRSETFWFSDTPMVPGSMTWGNRYERICTWAYFEDREGPAFYAYNLHIDHESQPSRERSADLLMKTIEARAPKAPVVVTGDFNSGEDNPAAKTVGRTLRDTYRVLHPGEKEVGTFNGFTFGKTDGDKIDYVFVEPGTEVIAATIIRTSVSGHYPSDHFPITATVRLAR